MNTYSNPQTNSRALVDQTLILCGIIAIAFIALIVVSITLGATLLGMEFARWSAVILTFGASLLIAALIVRTWNSARYLLVEPIAAYVTRQDADSAKVKAEAEKILAEADRIDAESNAIKTDAPAIFQTVSAGAGAKVKASITAPRVSVQGKSVSWNQVNQLDQTTAEPKRLEFPREDWLWMLEQFVKVKHSKRPFVTERVPFSQQPAYPELYNEVIRILVEGEAIKGRAAKTAGHLVVTDVNQLARLVEAAHPKGMIIDATPTPALLESGK